MLREFQKNGIRNWEAARKNKRLLPFAWAYETVQFVKKAYTRKISGNNFLNGFIDSRSRRKLMRKLGAKDISLGTVRNIEGKYINDKQH